MITGFSRIVDSPRAAFAFLTVAILLAYVNVWHNEFVFDDLVLISRDRFLTSWRYAGALFSSHLGDGFSGVHFHSPFYRPLQMLLYLAVYQLAGPSPVAFHALNVVLHIVNACLLYTLGLRLGFRKDASLCGALLWALHPVHTEAITYMSGTADPLCALFLLAGILILAGSSDRRHVLAACACQILALLSKESAVVFPLLAMTLIFYQSKDREKIKSYFVTWPFWVIAGVYLCVRAYLSGRIGFFDAFADSNPGFANRLLTAAATLPTYLRLIMWPSGLHVEREFSVHGAALLLSAAAGVVIVTASMVFVVRAASPALRPFAWGVLWATAAHIPQTGIFAPVNAPVCEHWLYLPTMGILLGAMQSLAVNLSDASPRAKSLPAALLMLAVILLGFRAAFQNRVWSNAETLYQNAFDHGETSDRAHVNLGEYYLGRGEFDKAVAQLEIPVSDHSPLSRWPELHFLLAAGYLHVSLDEPSIHEEIGEIARSLPLAKRIPDAKHELDAALALDPGMFWANEMLAQIYAYQGENDEAREYLIRAGATAARGRLSR